MSTLKSGNASEDTSSFFYRNLLKDQATEMDGKQSQQYVSNALGFILL